MIDRPKDISQAWRIMIQMEANLKRAEYVRLQQVSFIKKVEAERDRYKQGITDYLEGNYEHPRSHRPHDCAHGTRYYQECESCNTTHFEKVLNREQS